MCNQFIKANATNTAQVRAQRQEEKRDAQSRGNDVPEWKKKGIEKIKGASDGKEAKKDAELVLYEFLNMLVRIAFWRANPSWGLWVDKDKDGKMDKQELVPVPYALSNMLNDIILPKAKRENSAAFRQKEMQDPKLLAVLDSVRACPSNSSTPPRDVMSGLWSGGECGGSVWGGRVVLMFALRALLELNLPSVTPTQPALCDSNSTCPL